MESTVSFNSQFSSMSQQDSWSIGQFLGQSVYLCVAFSPTYVWLSKAPAHSWCSWGLEKCLHVCIVTPELGWALIVIGASMSKPHLVELLNKMYVRTIRRAVNQLQLLFYVFLHHASIQKWFTTLNVGTTLEWHQQRARERERTVTETVDERTARVHLLCVASSLTLTPQCSTFS